VKKCLTLNGQCKVNEIFFWLFIPFNFPFPTYLHKELGVSFLPTYVNKFEFLENFNLKEKERIKNLD
jgi:hypothetical protein